MKRNVTIAVLVTVIAALSVLFMPRSLSRQAEAKAPAKEEVHRKKGMRVELSGSEALKAMNALLQDPGAAQRGDEFISRQAVAFGVTPKTVRELAKLPEAQVGAGRTKREQNGEEGEREKNLNDRVKFSAPGVVGDHDPLAGLFGGSNQPLAMPTPSLTFLGQIQTESMCG